VPTHLASSALTSDFREEFEAELDSLLRRRFMWFSGTLAGLGLALWATGIGAAAAMMHLLPGRTMSTGEVIAAAAVGLVAIACYAFCFVIARRGKISGQALLRLTYTLVVLDGVLQVGASWAGLTGSAGLLGVLLTHVLACSFLPWTARQAIMPLIPVLALDAVLTFVLGRTSSGESTSLGVKAVQVVLSAGVGVPGTMLCWLRHNRRLESYKLRFFQRRYGEVRRELVDARRIHESLFPPPVGDGPIRFSYLYEPMRQIGGDYLYACRSGSPGRFRDGDLPLNIVLMDVTGHGIPAALTVNRLYGELQRVFAEHPDIRPGEVLSLLNRYVHLTLATHSVYVTAVCFRFDLERNELEYASGGHPPAYLRGVDGTVHELISTAFVLGACADEDYQSEPCSMHFGPGDTLIAYTDGALEARGKDGRMIGLAGIRRMIAGAPRNPSEGWPASVLRSVEKHRFGPPCDDTLVIEVMRPIGAA